MKYTLKFYNFRRNKSSNAADIQSNSPSQMHFGSCWLTMNFDVVKENITIQEKMSIFEG